MADFEEAEESNQLCYLLNSLRSRLSANGLALGFMVEPAGMEQERTCFYLLLYPISWYRRLVNPNVSIPVEPQPAHKRLSMIV